MCTWLPHLTGFTSKRGEYFVTFPHHIGTRDPILMLAFYRALYLCSKLGASW